MKKAKLLWVDDEIDLLKPHILFLEEKGYDVETASNGSDAIDLVDEKKFDLLFLDENMPGISGLETLMRIKENQADLPIVMVTKSEEEDIMDAAIGSQIADYLIKPVKPNQILLSIKKHIDKDKLVTEKTTSDYRTVFGDLGSMIHSAQSFDDWSDLYKKLVYWELELEKSADSGMDEVLRMQKSEANVEFGKYIKEHYIGWFGTNESNRPLISPNVIKEAVLPILEEEKKTVLVVIDNLRYDQWRSIQPIVSDYFEIISDETYCSILPTATQYSRNSIFSGLMPKDIADLYPGLWLFDDEEGGKNQHEQELLELQLKRLGMDVTCHFEKISNNKAGNKLVGQINNLLDKNLIVLVYNFVDMLSHANTDLEMIRELASNDSAYRSLTQSWFQHSHLKDLLKILAAKRMDVVITTDHGTIRVDKPIKVVGDRNTSKNLRYKLGRNLSYKSKEVFEVIHPEDIRLPKQSISSKYIFALGNDFLAYPNNFNHYVKYYSNTYQHGGVSMEEMILPLVHLKSKL